MTDWYKFNIKCDQCNQNPGNSSHDAVITLSTLPRNGGFHKYLERPPYPVFTGLVLCRETLTKLSYASCGKESVNIRSNPERKSGLKND